jgi:hypothetical protein
LSSSSVNCPRFTDGLNWLHQLREESNRRGSLWVSLGLLVSGP